MDDDPQVPDAFLIAVFVFAILAVAYLAYAFAATVSTR